MPKKVLVRVDSESGSFKYEDEKQRPAQRVKVQQGDDLSWNVRLDGQRTEFQITFKNLSPFEGTREIRSEGGSTSPLSAKKHAGRGMSYTVTLPNGWSNDPEAIGEGAGAESNQNATADVEIPIETVAGKVPLSPLPQPSLAGAGSSGSRMTGHSKSPSLALLRSRTRCSTASRMESWISRYRKTPMRTPPTTHIGST